MIHVAVLYQQYIDAILQGRKTVESRLAMTRQPPFARVKRGQRIYFKQSGGPFRATAIAQRITYHEDLTPGDVRRLRAEYADLVLAPPAYWRDKRGARCATFIHLSRVEAITHGPTIPTLHGRAWVCLPITSDVYPRCRRRARAASLRCAL